ncbi:MAG: MarR family transcriptional regulator [Acidobacteriia bacterium]|nr:MarR family transcriptional regulator [Terriglobia bacterium]
MRHYPTQKEKTQRAMQAYMDLIDAASWLRGELHAPLESFGLTMGEFRVLELLNREGTLLVADVARRRKATRQNMKVMIQHLEGRGWVRRVIVALPPVPFEESHRAKSRRGEKRKGKRRGVVGLTKSGKKFFREVLPRHSKLVKSLFRALSGREQMTLSRLCRKLREGDIVKFFREIRMQDEEE